MSELNKIQDKPTTDKKLEERAQERTAEETSKDDAADEPGTMKNVEERSQDNSAEPEQSSNADNIVDISAPPSIRKRKLAREPPTSGERPPTDSDICEDAAVGPFFEVQKTAKRLELNQQDKSDQPTDNASTSSEDSDFVGQSSGIRERALELASLGEGSTTDNDDICGDVASLSSFLELHGSRKCYDLSEQECRYAAGDSGGFEEVVVGPSLELPVLEEHSQESTAKESSKNDAADEPGITQNVEELSQDKSVEPGQSSPVDDIVDILAPPSYRRSKLARKPATEEDQLPTDSDICEDAAVGPICEVQKTEKRLELNQRDRSDQREDKASTSSDDSDFGVQSCGMQERALELANLEEESTTGSDVVVGNVASVLSVIEMQESKKCYDLREQELGSAAVESGNLEEVDTTPSAMLTKLEGQPTKSEDKSPARSGGSGDEVATPESIEPEGADEINRDIPKAGGLKKCDAH